MLIGREPDAAVLGEASAWQLARSVVAARPTRGSSSSTPRSTSVTGAVLSLSRALAENVADSRDVRAMTRDFLAHGRAADRGAAQAHRLRVVRRRPRHRRRAAAAARTRRRATPRRSSSRGFVEFSDQVALALAICERQPEVVAEHRERYRAVLLDEYQDTSVVQTRLLSALFGEQAVMAVGDPDQSIYGWRGASAANLARFGRDFAPGGDAAVYDLSTSWRNPKIVLEAANALILPLDAGIAKAPLGASPFAPPGRLEVAWAETIEHEADLVADVVRRTARRAGRGAGRPAPAAAPLLCRTFATSASSPRRCAPGACPSTCSASAACSTSPRSPTSCACLRVLHDPTAGSELVRVLAARAGASGVPTSPRCARSRRGSPRATTPTSALADEVRAGLRASVARRRARLDRRRPRLPARGAPTRTRRSPRSATWASPACARAARSCSRLRRRAGLGLVDFVTSCSRSCCSTSRSPRTPAQPLGGASLEAFDERARGLRRRTRRARHARRLPRAGSTEAEQRDRLAPRQRRARAAAPCRCSRSTARRASSGTSSACRAWSTASCREAALVEGLARRSASCPTSSAATPTNCPSCVARRAEPGGLRPRGRRLRRRELASATPTRSAASPTSRSPAHAATCC